MRTVSSGPGMRAFSVLLPVLALAVSGCVDLQAEATVARDGSGRLVVDYKVPRALEPLDRYAGEMETLPFPLERTTLERRAQQAPGVTVVRWSREDLADEIRINVELRFSSLPALVGTLDPSGKRLSYTSEAGRRTLRAVLSNGVPSATDAARWAHIRYDAYAVTLSVTLPSPAVSAEPGSLSASRNTASYSSRTAALIERSDPLVWTIQW